MEQQKNNITLFGNNKGKDEIRESLALKFLICGSFVVQVKQPDEYLGELFKTYGLFRSALETIIARRGKIKAVSYETSLLRRLQAQTVPNTAPPMGKIYPFSKIAVTFEPIQRF